MSCAPIAISHIHYHPNPQGILVDLAKILVSFAGDRVDHVEMPSESKLDMEMINA
jgi:hypothetical protein